MVTFTVNIPQMFAYIPCMDPMGQRWWINFKQGKGFGLGEMIEFQAVKVDFQALERSYLNPKHRPRRGIIM
jgi:hypothetical protein